jgi:tape measure domain-containing protein
VTNETRNVDLVIRAKNMSKKTLEDVQKELVEINKAIDAQVEASKRGEGSLKALNATYADLEKAMAALAKQQSLVGQFKDQATQLEALQKQLGAASTRLKEFQTQTAGAEGLTKRQEQTQTRLTKAVERSESALGKQVDRLAKTRTEAEGLGLDMNNLVQTQDRLTNTSRELANTNVSLTQGLDQFADNTKAAARAAKELADTDAFNRAARDAAQLVKASEYVRFWEQELTKLDAIEKEQREAKIFAEKARDAQNLVKASEYANFWVAALEKADAAERQLQDSTALNAAADRAIAAARGYTTLGNAAQTLINNTRPLAEQIRAIVSPAAEAMTNINSLEQSIKKMSATVAAIKGPVGDYREQVKALGDAQKALASQGAGIDAYQKQVAALRDARAGFSAARAELLQFAAATRASSAPTAEMAATQKRLEAALASASGQLQQQIGTTREMRAALEQAGIATNDLAGAQARLLGSARSTSSALNDLNAAAKKYGTEVDDAGKKQSFFESSGRTSLSFIQRLRGEVLALAAAYVGLQGSIDLANKSIEASNTKQGIQNQLALAVGDDPKAIAAEYKYIRDQADRIGVSFEEAAKGYAKFAAAAKLAGRSTEEIHYVSEAFQEVGRVANLTADDMGGVFKALEQIYSKGKIQAEELRGQLGDRLFGAFEIAAKALTKQFPNLDKAMQQGQVTSQELLAIAEQYRITVANRLPTAMESLASNQARLNSAFFDFKVLLADSGFADAYGELVQKLSAFFRSDDGTKFAQDLSTAFSAVVTGLGYLLDHLDEVKLLLEIVFGVTAAKLVFGFAAAIITASKNMLILNAAVAEGTVKVGLLQKAFLGLAAFFVGWEIGSYLNDQFEIVRQAGVALVIGFEKAFTSIAAYSKIAWTAVAGFAEDSFNNILNKIETFRNKVFQVLGTIADKAGQTDLAAALFGAASKTTDRAASGFQTKIDGIKDQLKKDLSQIDEIGFEMFQDASDNARKVKDKDAEVIKPTAKPEIARTPAAEKPDKEYEKLVKRRIALAEELVNALAAAETKIQKNEKLSLTDRLAAIDTEYQKVFLKIDKLEKLPGGAETAKNMRATLTSYVEQLKTQETLKFNQEEMARREKAINDLLALRSQLLQTIAAQQKAGQLTPDEVKQKIAGVDEKINPQISGAIQSAQEFATANANVFDNQAGLDTYLAKLDAIKAGLVTINTELLTAAQVNDKLASGLTGAFDQFAKSVGEGANVLDSLKDAFLNFAASFLREIALMIIKQIILNALQSTGIGGAVAGAANGLSGTSKNHSGGVIGSGNMGGTKVNMPSSYFANAPKYHTGGVVGLSADEYPAVLQRNEEVLAADDPRNTLNGGAAQNPGVEGQPPSGGIKIINQIDSVGVLDAALSTKRGERLIMNVLQANRRSVQTLVKS